MHYLITGHTGFKGAWLTLWLTSQGHQVSGISLDPLPGALYEIARIKELVLHDLRVDIRNFDQTNSALKEISPDAVFHMAAQPLVRDSYRDPRGTVETNVVGTLNVLEAVSSTPSVKAHVVVTTDKVYRNVNQNIGYVESDPLGGDDPYSASKAMADILTQSWIKSFSAPPTAVVRAGNVIGGGDVSPERLLPDLINAFSKGREPVLRYPNSVRPWQHVLDCLNGYILISNALLEGQVIGEINIGPGLDSFISVREVTEYVAEKFNFSGNWRRDLSNEIFHEAEILALDATKAKDTLDWVDKLTLKESLNWTIDWYKSIFNDENAREVSLNQINRFERIKLR